ncbi:MAG: helix-turn-helix domain-containing protein [Acidobacteria bacterium]|nr:helix-turn-helix domain-containing protein [Acidobacteriota bacterium]
MNAPPDGTLLISVPEAAHFLDISPRTAYRLIRAGTFPVSHIKVGKRTKVVWSELMAFIHSEGITHEVDSSASSVIS